MKNYIVEIVSLIDLRNDVIVVIDQLNLVEIFLKKKRKEHFFFSGEKCVRYETKLYHKSCFVCNACQQPLINTEFQRHDQYILCLPCHLLLLGIYCIKCHKVSN